MKKRKREISVVKYEMLQGLTGICWISYGVLNLFDNLICLFLKVIVAFIAVIAIGYEMFVKKQTYDEMAEQHLLIAKARVLGHLRLIIVSAGFISILMNTLVMDYAYVFPFVMGTVDLLVSVYFIRYEKAGV